MNLVGESVFENGVDSSKLYDRAFIREDTGNKRGTIKGYSFASGRSEVREVLKMTSKGRTLGGGLGGIRLGRVYSWSLEFRVYSIRS